MYGVQSIMNPYCVTRLVGGLGKTGDKFRSYMYDVRDQKRFFDNQPEAKGNIVNDEYDFTSILNPTVTNIIAWSNKDKWGRTPYSFQDFVFCKYWNIIPNNRLITFRKYGVPTFDNLNFPNMVTESGEASDIKCAPIATVVTYFGGESPNKLGDFLKFATGTLWEEINADVHKVSGDMGDNPHAVIDRMNERSGFNGVGSLSNIINQSLNKTGFLTGQYFSFAKFTGMLDKDGFTGPSQAAFEKLSAANVDPTESLFSNRVIGPVNRVSSVQKRKAGIEFSQQFTLICQYVARPIGGVNTKAALLDILANCMEIASPEAVFWGGGYRFMIKPHLYPFKNTKTKNNIMDALYAGKIFGNDGAIANALSGLRSFGTADGSGDFKWSNVTANLGNILGQTMGAIGGMLQSISSTLFGESSKLSSWLKSGTDALSSEEQQAAGESKLNNLFGNLNKMWKDQVIQETTLPSIEGMRALLTGTPVGNWHLTIGNPLNPIMVCGNLICKKMDVEFGEELGPDDFPLELKVTYTIEHAMARDKAAIQSMFNRGSGRIYKLPDYITATSDFETKVDKYTGNRFDGSYYTPQFMKSATLMNMSGAHGYQTYKLPPEAVKQLSNNGEVAGNPETTFIPTFSIPDNQAATMMLGNPNKNMFLQNRDVRSVIAAPITAQKMMD